MSYFVKDVSREEMNKLLFQGYLLFEVTHTINDDVIERNDLLCKEGDFIFKSSEIIISLDSILQESIKVEIFNESIYSEEEIADKISAHTIFDIKKNGDVEKVSFKYRKIKISN